MCSSQRLSPLSSEWVVGTEDNSARLTICTPWYYLTTTLPGTAQPELQESMVGDDVRPPTSYSVLRTGATNSRSIPGVCVDLLLHLRCE